MRICASMIAATLALAGCYTPSQAELEAEADRLAAMSSDTAAAVEAEARATGAACGTVLVLSAGVVIIDAGATAAQVACVRQRDPAARVAGR